MCDGACLLENVILKGTFLQLWLGNCSTVKLYSSEESRHRGSIVISPIHYIRGFQTSALTSLHPGHGLCECCLRRQLPINDCEYLLAGLMYDALLLKCMV